MRIFNKFILILSFLLGIQNLSNAEQLFKFANVDLIINETKIGNQMLNKIKNLDIDNIEKLKSFEKQIQEMKNEIQIKKNV